MDRVLYRPFVFDHNLYGECLSIHLSFKRFDKNLFGLRNFPVSILGTLTVSIVALFFAHFLHQMVLEGMPPQEFWAKQSLRYYWVSLIIAFVVGAIFYAFFYDKYRQ